MSQATLCFLLIALLQNTCAKLVDCGDELCQHGKNLELHLRAVVS